MNEEVPSRQSSQRFTQSWATRDVRRVTRLKKRWFKRAKKSKSDKDWSKYKEIKRRAQLVCRKAHDSHVSTMLREDHENPKVFWSFIKSRKKDNFGVSALKKTASRIAAVSRKRTSSTNSLPLFSPRKTYQILQLCQNAIFPLPTILPSQSRVS